MAGLLVACLVYGVAPGAVLRLILLVFPKNHPRRLELPAEMQAVPYKYRPIWVSEQLEVAIREGLPARWAKTREERRRALSAARRALRLLASTAPMRSARGALAALIPQDHEHEVVLVLDRGLVVSRLYLRTRRRVRAVMFRGKGQFALLVGRELIDFLPGAHDWGVIDESAQILYRTRPITRVRKGCASFGPYVEWEL